MNTVNRTAAFVLLCALAFAGCPAEDGGYTITFDKQGGEGGAESARAVVGQAPPAITVPAKEGWVFLGYRTKENGGQPYYSSTGKGIGRWYIASDTTLYAWWEDSGVSPANLASYLARLQANTASVPYTIPLVEGTNISGGGWAAINSAVQSAGRFVILDLWACTASGNTVTGAGASSPSDSDFNIIGDNEYIKGVVLPSTLTSVGAYALSNCSNLTSVTIPARVTSIGDNAFSGCAGLTSVTIPAGVTSIGGEGPFAACANLSAITVDAANRAYSSEDGVLFNKTKTTLVQYPAGHSGVSYIIPPRVTSVGACAFYHCESLTSVTIPEDSVTSIGQRAFEGCAGLTSVTIPGSVTDIGTQAFAACANLSAITVNAANTVYSSEDGVLFNKAKTTLVQYPAGHSGVSYIIPDSVTSVGNGAFTGCVSLTSVTIGDGVTRIEDRAFYGCTRLTSVTFEGSAAVVDNSDTFPSGASLLSAGGAASGGAPMQAGAYTLSGGVWTKQ